MDSMCKENVGISSFFNTRQNQPTARFLLVAKALPRAVTRLPSPRDLGIRHAQVRCVAERPNQKFSITHKLLSQVSPWKARYFPSGEGSGLIIHRRRPFGHRRVTVPLRVAYTKSNESAPQQLIKKPLPCVAHAIESNL